MSEFDNKWQIGVDPYEIQSTFEEQLEILNSRTDIPHGEKWDIAYGLASMGGPENSVLISGVPGSGKSKFAEIIAGSRNVLDIRETDTDQTLMGYERPVGGGHNYGTIGKLVSRENDPALVLDELGHLGSTGALHPIWNGRGFNILGGDQFVDTTAMPIIATTNYPNRPRVKPLDEAIRSRFAAGFVAGEPRLPIKDNGKKEAVGQEPGMLPPEKVRRQIQELLGAHRLAEAPVEDYANTLVQSMNASGMFKPIYGDARIGQGWQQIVRAQRLVEGGAVRPYAIGYKDIGRVAAIGLGASAQISNEGIRSIQEKTERMTLTEHEKGIITHRLVAALAFKALVEKEDDLGLKPVHEDKLRTFINTRSYTETDGMQDIDAIDDAVIQMIVQPSQNGKESVSNERTRRFSLRRRS